MPTPDTIDVPAQATAPAEWPVGIPFLPWRAAHLMPTKGMSGVVWPGAPVPGAAGSEARMAQADLEAAVASGEIGTVIDATRRVFEATRAPDDSASVASLRQTLAELTMAILAAGWSALPTPLPPAVTPNMEGYLYERGAESLQVHLSLFAREPGLIAMYRRLTPP